MLADIIFSIGNIDGFVDREVRIFHTSIYRNDPKNGG